MGAHDLRHERDSGIMSPVSISAAQADAFYTEVLRSDTVWGIRDADGFPAPDSGGHRAMPFWSAESRARRIIERVEAYRAFEVVSLPLDVWRSRWLPGLAKDGLLVGLNWSGPSATGYDVTPADAEAALVARR